MDNPKYTFLIPAYKATYLEEALRRIQNQVFTSFRVIVSDDDSPEDIKTIVDAFVDDSRFVYRRNEENIGGKSLVNHWNLLLSLCQTDYLIMASDDDFYEPNFLLEIEYVVNKYPNTNMYRGRMGAYDNTLNEIKLDKKLRESVTQKEYLEDFFGLNFCKCMANFVFKTQALRDAGGFFEMPLAWFSDEITSLIMSRKGCCNTKEIVFHFRVSGINISNSIPTPSSAYKKAIATIRAVKWLDHYIKTIDGVSPLFARKACERWTMLLYEWLNLINFGDFIKILPSVVSLDYIEWSKIHPVINHQLKSFFVRK